VRYSRAAALGTNRFSFSLAPTAPQGDIRQLEISVAIAFVYAVKDGLRLAVLMSSQQFFVDPQSYRVIVVRIFNVPLWARLLLLNDAFRLLLMAHPKPLLLAMSRL